MMTTQSVGHWLLSISLQATVLLCGAALGALLMRRASAASRHLMWALTIVALLLLPILNGVVPPRKALVADRAAPFLSNWFLAASATQPEVNTAPSVTSTGVAPAESVTGENAAPSWFSTLGATWPQLVALVWLLGILVCGARVFYRVRLLRRLQHDSVALHSGPLWEEMQEARHALQLHRGVKLLLATQEAKVVVPLTWGQRRPVVLLPPNAPTWSPLQRRAVLLHELAHVERGDWMTQLASQVACAVYWFHPLVWLAAHRLRNESERATDDRVLSAGVCAGDYGQCLLDFVRLLQATPGRTIMKEAIAVARPSNFESRLRALLDTRRNRRGVSRFAVMAALGGMGVVAMTLATVRVTNSAPTPAAISSTSSPQKIDLSSPEATLRSFIAALNRYDVNGAAACVEGGQVSAMLKELPKSLKEFRVSMRVEGLQTSVRKNEATVTVERFVVQQYAAGAPPERRDMTQEIGAQNVFVQRRAGKWKLVPPARIASTEPETSLSRYISLFAMTREVEQTMRAEAYEAVCISNMRQLGLGVFQMSFIANQPLRLKGSLKKNLEAHIRSGGDSGNSVTAARVEPLFHCPADKSDAGSYSFNRNLEGMTQQDVDRLANPRRTVLLYEGKNGRLDFRHNGRATVGFTDGSARLVDRQQAKSLRWK